MISATTTHLFDKCERTHPGRSDRLHESEFDYLNRSARPRAAAARDLCERWFTDYSNDASREDIKDLRGRFRDKRLTQHHGAWFELLAHQILVRLGFEVLVHQHIRGSDHNPDFAASSAGSRIYVEATAAGVRSALPHEEEDAMQKLADLVSENFYVSIDRTEGELTKLLARKKLLDPFKRFLEAHDPEVVQRRTEKYGESARPRCTIRFGEWKLFVSLWPASPGRRLPRDNRVNRLSRPENYTYVPDARRSIADKLKDYRRIDDTLVLAISVYDLWEGHLVPVARDTVFGSEGSWGPGRAERTTPAGVLFFSNSRPYGVRGIGACLCINPSVRVVALPPALLRLPSVEGPGRLRTNQRRVHPGYPRDWLNARPICQGAGLRDPHIEFRA